MKKLLILGLLATLGAAFIFSSNYNTSTSVNSKERVVLFGKIDLSDDSDDEDNISTSPDDNSEDKDDWLGNFIRTHKTPFSKTVTR